VFSEHRGTAGAGAVVLGEHPTGRLQRLLVHALSDRPGGDVDAQLHRAPDPEDDMGWASAHIAKLRPTGAGPTRRLEYRLQPESSRTV
jgi:hypothetical protein